MLNIEPKKVLEEVLSYSYEEFLSAKEVIFKKNAKKDISFLISNILPLFEESIAIKNLIYDNKNFSFSIPALSFYDYKLTENEMNRLSTFYYNNFITSLSNHIPKNISTENEKLLNLLFSSMHNSKYADSYELVTSSNTVSFEAYLTNNALKFKSEKIKTIANLLDKYLSPDLNFENIAEGVNNLLNTLQKEEPLIVGKNDFFYYPVLSLDVDKTLTNTDLFSDLNIESSDVEIELNNYFKHSKLIASIKRKFKKYGHNVRFHAVHYCFDESKSSEIRVTLDYSNTAKKTAKDDLVASRDSIFDGLRKKEEQFQNILKERFDQENPKLFKLVETGSFDENIAKAWMEATVMGIKKLTSSEFIHNRNSENLYFNFKIPFNRDLPEIKHLIPSNNDSNQLGSHYLNSDNNIVTALRNRYPFFEDAKIFGLSRYDFQSRDESSTFEKAVLIPNTIEFQLSVSRVTYILKQKEILDWLSSHYGITNINQTLEEIQLNANGIKQKIEDFIKLQKEKEISSQESFEIVLAELSYDHLLKSYKNSPIYFKSKEIFDKNHEDDISSFEYLSIAYLKAKKHEFQSLKLANLFVHSCFSNDQFKEIKKSLEDLGYDLTFDYVLNTIEKIDSGKRAFDNSPIIENSCEYSLKIVIK